MRIEFTKSSRRHRIAKGRALWVIIHTASELTFDSGRTEVKWIGKDNRGLELEIIGVIEEEKVLILHVMPYSFRRKYEKKI